MSIIFDQSNAFLNGFFNELMAVQIDDRIIEIGSGTGKLIYKMAQKIDTGLIEGIDFSNTMVSIAQKRNKRNIANGKVTIIEGNFDEIPYEKDKFTKACSINTLYFWPKPEHTVKKIADILKPEGKLILTTDLISSYAASERRASTMSHGTLIILFFVRSIRPIFSRHRTSVCTFL